MTKTKEEILRKAMSVKYCGETRFDFLDADEFPLIFNAMQIYSDQQAIPLLAEIERLKGDIPEGKPEKVVQRMWNKNFVPKYADGIQRYQDPENGLWKRLM